MSTIKQSSIFTLFLIIFSFIFRYCSVYKSGADIHFLAVAVSVLLAGFVGGVGFYLGQLTINDPIAVKHLAFLSGFVYLLSHTTSNFLGLYQISWFAYAALLFVLAFITALRAPKMFNKEKYS
ncbi:hypothetical protein [Ferrimonas gelatinilytica]|uniref:hypothetical protein n=1 Tax=Ferrimonas gelatinilytica TaxID=1255257 RepID=UPI0031E577D3